MLYAPRIYLLESLSKTFYVAVCTSTRNFRPRCVSPPLGGEGSGEKKERKIKGAREFVYRPEREKERERIFYFLAPCVNSTACMDVGFFEEENFAILLHNSLYFDRRTIISFRPFFSNTLSILNIELTQREGEGNVSRVPPLSLRMRFVAR